MHTRLTQALALERGQELRHAADRHRPAGAVVKKQRGVFMLPNGTGLIRRAVERTDRDRIHALFYRLGEESRYRRYLTPKPRLSQRELGYLSDIDHFSHEAIAAIDPRHGSFVGIVRVVQRPDWPGAAEMAIEVEDDLHRLGIGSWLTQSILERARELGFATVTATTLRHNPPARALLKRFGFEPHASAGSEIELVRTLTSPWGRFA